MTTAKYFDVHDKNITPEIYILLFSGVVTEIKGNDIAYDISRWVDPEYLEELKEDGEEPDYYVKDWEKQIKRGPNNCYFDREAMKEFIANPCSVTAAINRFIKWLKENGVNEGDTLLVYIWW